MIRSRLAAVVLIVLGTAPCGAAEAAGAAPGAGQRATHRLLRPSTARPQPPFADFIAAPTEP